MTEKRFTSSEMRQYILDQVKRQRPETVEKLIMQVKMRYPLSEAELLEYIIELENQGKLRLKAPPEAPPATLKSYVLSSHGSWYWATAGLAVITTLLVFAVPESLYPYVYARYLLGALFVLWLPGYALVKALFPTKEIDHIERIALSLGMSLAVVPLTGLLLNYTPWGIRLTPITLSLLALTLVLATAAVFREYQIITQRS